MIHTDTALHDWLRASMARLSPEDMHLFQVAFQQEPVRYCNSWLYLLRSTRDNRGAPGYKFVGKNALIGVGCRNNSIYLVHPMGSERFSATLELCREIKQRTSWPIVLKKLDQALYEYLLTSDLFHHAPSYPTNRYTLALEEEAFPEHVLCLHDLCNTAHKAYQRSTFIRKVRHFEKYGLTLSSTCDIMHQDFSTLLSPGSEKDKCYRQMITTVNDQQREDYIACVYHDEHSTVHGLYIAEALAEGIMGLYCAVSSKEAAGITEWMDHDFFQQLYQRGIHTLYLGGSETQGVDTYVRKLFPSEPPYLLQPLVI